MDEQLKVTLPVDLEEYEENREQVESLGDGEHVAAPAITLPTLEDAQRAARRVAYLRKKASELELVFASEEAVLLAELEKVRLRKAEAVKPYERRMGWYLFALEEFHRARLAEDPKEKTIRLPSGDLSMRAQQPEWIYTDPATVTTVLHMYRTDLVRVKQETDKTALKKAARVQDGKVFIEDDNGELHELPITVQDRPPKFEFKVS
jgi:phage host-nuclease inhibitor protein Gam